jgi:hypothetical protein
MYIRTYGNYRSWVGGNLCAISSNVTKSTNNRFPKSHSLL